jgi:hypothetical protein
MLKKEPLTVTRGFRHLVVADRAVLRAPCNDEVNITFDAAPG